MDNLQTTKSTLARLLATENLNIDIRKAETASFNTKTRTLTLPLWEDTSPELYDLLVGHEVGHALDTPEEGWHDAVMENMKPGFKTFLNVVEDARIERKIKTRYPGIRKSFGIGYRELNERDFFSIKGKDINDFLLIDRINIHFKLGVSADVRFNAEEQYFLDKVADTETFEDVYQVAKELYEYCQQEMKDKLEQAPEPQPGEPGEGEDSNSIGDPFQDDSEGNGQSSDGNQMRETDQDGNGGSPNDDGEGEDEDSSDITSGKDSGPNDTKANPMTSYDPKSVTDESFQNKVKKLSSSNGEILTGKIPKTTAFEPFVHWKELINRIAYEEAPGSNMRYLKEFEAKNKNALMYLVKEFEMRKKAAELRRVSVAQTGQLDTNKLHTYKFNDDIFRRVANVSQGKNHGLFLVLDWSGSMGDHLKGTVEQLITLTQFCKKVSVPFEVVAFSSEYGRSDQQISTFTSGEISLENTRLLNFLSSTMPDRVYRKQCADMLAAVSYYRGISINDRSLGLGSTPLNTTIMILPKYINAFRTKHRLQIVNTVFLTDGEDSSGIRVYGDNGRIKHHMSQSTANRDCIIIDQETKKTYKIPAKANAVTPTLLKILKDKTGCNLIGFYITNNYRSNFTNVMVQLTGDLRYDRNSDYNFADGEFRKWKEDKVCVVNNWGFDEYYIIPGGSSLRVNDDDLDELIGETKATARKLRGAFLKMNQNRLTNRVLLKKFIERVS